MPHRPLTQFSLFLVNPAADCQTASPVAATRQDNATSLPSCRLLQATRTEETGALRRSVTAPAREQGVPIHREGAALCLRNTKLNSREISLDISLCEIPDHESRSILLFARPRLSSSFSAVLRADAQPRCNAPLRRHGICTTWHCFCYLGTLGSANSGFFSPPHRGGRERMFGLACPQLAMQV